MQNMSIKPSMANNHFVHNNQHRQPGGMAAFLLGMGEMPPPRNQDIAVAMANHMLDNQFQGPVNAIVQDENINHELRMPLPLPPAAQVDFAGMNLFLLFSSDLTFHSY